MRDQASPPFLLGRGRCPSRETADPRQAGRPATPALPVTGGLDRAQSGSCTPWTTCPCRACPGLDRAQCGASVPVPRSPRAKGGAAGLLEARWRSLHLRPLGRKSEAPRGYPKRGIGMDQSQSGLVRSQVGDTTRVRQSGFEARLVGARSLPRVSPRGLVTGDQALLGAKIFSTQARVPSRAGSWMPDQVSGPARPSISVPQADRARRSLGSIRERFGGRSRAGKRADFLGIQPYA